VAWRSAQNAGGRRTACSQKPNPLGGSLEIPQGGSGWLASTIGVSRSASECAHVTPTGGVFQGTDRAIVWL
jgi:hypothetical protein